MTELKKILLFCLGFVLLYNLFFFKVAPGLGWFIVIIFLNIYFYFIRSGTQKNLPFALLNSAVGITFSLLFAYRANGVVRFFDFLLSGGFSLIALFLYKAEEEFKVNTLDYLLIPLQILIGSFQGISDITKEPKQKSEAKSAVNAALLRGMIIAVPVFLILLGLLSSADPIFGKLAGDIFSSLGDRTLFSIIIFLVLLCLGLIRARVQKNKEVEHSVSLGKVHELSLILGSILILFASFIVIQFRYLFSSVSERDLAAVGVKSLTYSQYVNQGFFELLVVGAIAGLVILYAIRSIHSLHSSEKLLIQTLGGLLALETWLILLSDFKRLSLYANAHGLTQARVFGFIFLVWLTLYLILLVWQMLQRLSKEVAFSALLCITLPILFLTNVFNIDDLIATRYVPTVNGEVDYYYIAGLSADASSSWPGIITAMNQQISELEKVQKLSSDDSRKVYWIKSTVGELDSSVSNLKDRYQGNHFKWQSLNISDYMAYQIILQNQDLFGKIQNLKDRSDALDKKIDPETRANTNLDRSTNPPLSQ